MWQLSNFILGVPLLLNDILIEIYMPNEEKCK